MIEIPNRLFPCAARITDSKDGNWRIEQFDISEPQAQLFNLRVAMGLRSGRGSSDDFVEPGRFVRLIDKRTGNVMMSTTPMELRTNARAVNMATGRVLIGGLGLGVILDAILRKPDVTHVTVIENDPSILRMVAPAFQPEVEAMRLEFVADSVFTWEPLRGARWDFTYMDIWATYGAHLAPEMRTLRKKYGRRSATMAQWRDATTSRAHERAATRQTVGERRVRGG